MNDSDTNLGQLKNIARVFCDERDWGQYQSPKDLTIGMAIEVSEVLEHFRYKTDATSKEIMKDSAKKEEISDEMSDVLYHLLLIAELYGIDISGAFNKKMEQNRKKYPVEKFKGINKKYNEL